MHYTFGGSFAALKLFLHGHPLLSKNCADSFFNSDYANLEKNSLHGEPVWLTSSVLRDLQEVIESAFPSRPRLFVWECTELRTNDQIGLMSVLRQLDRNQSSLVLFSSQTLELLPSLRSRLMQEIRSGKSQSRRPSLKRWVKRYSR